MTKCNACLVSDCCKPQSKRGYCTAHYHRLRKYGDPLGGGTSLGEPSRFLHEVAMQHTSDECLMWPFGKNNKGYGIVWVDGECFVASRYVCELAHGAPPTNDHEAAHSCGNGHECCISPGHLSWKTRVENEADKLTHGTHNRGERCGAAKLSENDVREILSLKGTDTMRNISERYGVALTTVAAIYSGRNWSWLQPSLNAGLRNKLVEGARL